MYIWVLLFPILNFFLLTCCVSSLRQIKQLTIFFSTLTVLFTSWVFYNVALLHKTCYICLGKWIYCDFLQVNWEFLFDSLSVVMLLVVSIISWLVHIYSLDYMAEDPYLGKFISYLSLFTFFMFFLVTAANFLQLFIGWEGVGLCSFLLISFWHTRVEALKSAMKAIIVNRIGDFGLTIGFVLLCLLFKSLDFSVIFAVAPYITSYTFLFCGVECNFLNLICFFFFLGVMGKSAQIGLHVWLADAMEGPTPVSALIHAATMVTAGVFLLMRCSILFELSPKILNLVVFFGAITAFLSGIIGITQMDIKKVIAYSTCSQLGYMIFVCGLSNYSLGAFHFSNHAFFKALLFLSAGAIIHGMLNEQDLRRYGGLYQILPFSYMNMLIGSLALGGFPFLSRFYSKDAILELSLLTFKIYGSFTSWLVLSSVFITACYSIRLLYLTFLIQVNFSKFCLKQIHEPSYFMCLSLFILSFFTFFIGYLTKDMFIGLGTDFWGNSLNQTTVYSATLQIDFEFLPFYIKNLPLMLTFLVFFLSLIFYANKSYLFFLQSSSLISFSFYKIERYFLKYSQTRLGFDKFFNYGISLKLLHYSFLDLYRLLDGGILVLLGPNGFYHLLNFLNKKVISWQGGYVLNYIQFFVIISLFFFICLFFFI